MGTNDPYVKCSSLFEYRSIFLHMLKIENGETPARLQYAHDFVQHLTTVFRYMQIVQEQTGGDHLKMLILEGHLTRISIQDFHAGLYPFPPGISECLLWTIAALISLAPNIDANRFPFGQAPGRGIQDQAAATPDVEHQFVPLQLN